MKTPKVKLVTSRQRNKTECFRCIFTNEGTAEMWDTVLPFDSDELYPVVGHTLEIDGSKWTLRYIEGVSCERLTIY